MWISATCGLGVIGIRCANEILGDHEESFELDSSCNGLEKLNLDGAVSNLERRDSIGGVLRDSNANCLGQKGFNKVVCDNALLVELLLSGGGTSSSLMELRLLHQVLRRKWEIRIRHIPRTFNGVADHMTKCDDTCSFLIRLFRSPPASVMNLLGRDRNMSIYY
ncbi:hypothetical protein Gotri_020776 [Gossypium trilobum]|uniref:RNase H type-1 domain-containing protein n=1 Tax=Gossypium trilobum TaxID=34281 RepID=A0A7J9DAE4_9ROSI|nr:hypothetical protein [Gossypium trilobum]